MVTVSRSCEQNGQPMARQFASSCGQSSAQQSHFLALPQPAKPFPGASPARSCGQSSAPTLD